jgi:hypothetical protein
MRTTVTLDSDAAAIVNQRMRERKVTFKQAINDVIRESVRQAPREPFVQKTSNMGVPTINLDKATQIAAELEDEEIIRKMRLGK